ncbi:MAG: bifunctional folylpolyglutamate synthase/dihydrofolate synthase [Acholeplasmataceae bacterium]
MFNTKNITDFLIKHNQFQSSYKTIHVGGTNGKGSVSHMIEAILSAEGYRVGLYTSPYDFKRFDNIKINRQMIKDEDVDAILELYKYDFENFQLTPFEIDTVIAFKYFYDAQVDFAIIEVGLGGIDDATNVINPILSIITNIGTDHQDVLGHTKREIATKKAGIIKDKTPALIGYGFDDDLYNLFQSVSRSNHAPLYITSEAKNITLGEKDLTFTYDDSKYVLPTQAYYQAQNAATTLKVIEVLQKQGIIIHQKSIIEGFKYPLPNKRFQWMSKEPLILMDGAHNLEGVKALIQSIHALNFKGHIKIICSILKDKPYLEMIEMLKTISEDMTLTTFDHPRAIDLNDVKISGVTLDSDYQSIITSIFQHKHDLTIMTGSLYFLSAVTQYLKEQPL